MALDLPLARYNLSPLLVLVIFGLNLTFSYANPNCYKSLQNDIQHLSTAALEGADAIHPSASSVLSHFVEISKVSRPSGHEAELRGKLIQDAKRLGLKYKEDPAGNLVVYVPSNVPGGEKLPSVLLQAHMDIVPNVHGIAKLEDAVSFYHNNSGVMPLEFNNGAIQSVNQLNTIGADDGSGVAIMMEYMRNPELKHPPLELLFTVEEETGLLGVKALGIPLTAKHAISLDSGEFNAALIGGQGCSRFYLEGAPLLRHKRPANHSSYSVTLSGFEGGHSAMKIGLGRANGVLELKNLLTLLKKEIPELEVLSLVGGTEGTYNAIPNRLSLDISLSAEDLAKLQATIKRFDDELRVRYQDIESFKQFKFEIKNIQSNLDALHWEEVEKTLSAINNVPQGPKNSTWPSSISDSFFSSNTAFLVIDEKGIRAGFMPRFLELTSHQAFANYLQSYKEEHFPNMSLTNGAFAPAWSSAEDNELHTLFRQNIASLNYPVETVIAMGSVEASYLSEMYPNMQMIVIGAQVDNAHQTNEAMPLVELAQTMRLLDNVLEDLASP